MAGIRHKGLTHRFDTSVVQAVEVLVAARGLHTRRPATRVACNSDKGTLRHASFSLPTLGPSCDFLSTYSALGGGGTQSLRDT